MSEKDGGSVFPTERETTYMGETLLEQTPGMSLRDWFAGQCMSALISADSWTEGGRPLNEREVSEQAYLYADAMLAARTPPTGETE